MKRRRFKHTLQEFKEIDYWSSLTQAEYEWLYQFLLEYYQADFNFDKSLHPKKFIKECRDRNNSAKRQIHSVGSDLLGDSVARIRRAQKNPQISSRYYVPEDYLEDGWEDYCSAHDKDDEDDDINS